MTPSQSESGTSRRGIAIAAIAGLSAILGLAIGISIAPHAWAVDAERNLRAGSALAAGAFGQDRGYLYSPLAALLTIPATYLAPGVAIAAWLVLRLALLLELVRQATDGLRPLDRVLVAVSVAMSVPVLYDLLLGNVSILLAAALAFVVWRRDDVWSGVPLGLLLATVPKPQLIPFLIWMLLWRRQALAGSLASAGVATLFTVALVGVEPYLTWIDILRLPDYLTGAMAGNLSLQALYPAIALPLSVLAVVVTIAGLSRGPLPGLVCCLCLGLLIAPYTMAYGAVALLPIVPALARFVPAPTVVLALTSAIGIIVAMPLWVACVMATAFRLPSHLIRPVEETHG